MASRRSWTAGSAAAGWGDRGRRWYRYRPVWEAPGSSPVASQTWVRTPSSRSSVAYGPPILVGTHPGSTALDGTSGQRRAMAKGQRHVQQLGLGVGLRGVPAPAGPLQVVEVEVAAVLHARGEVYQPLWSRDQRGQQVGGEHVDREHVGEPVGRGDALGLQVDAGVVDHRVEAAGGVGLLGDLAGLLDAGQVADHYRTGAGRGGAGVARAGGVAGVTIVTAGGGRRVGSAEGTAAGCADWRGSPDRKGSVVVAAVSGSLRVELRRG